MTSKTKRSMRILIVAEKPRAAEQITFALCERDKKPKLARKSPIKVWEIKRDGKVYRITSALGHLYTTEFAKSVHQKPWREVDPKYLLTKAPLVKVTRPESRKAIDVIREEARKAHLLIIATDYDREGENIGMQVAELIAKKVNPRIVVKRARFSSLTRKELLNAFKEENLVELDRRKIDASEVRQELDLRYGVAFTRLATIKFHERMGESGLPLLSIGPCQTPTLGLIVDRYLKHIESKERAEREKKYVIELTCMINGTGIKFKSIQEFQNPDGAKSYISSIGDSLEIENVSRKEVTIARPLPLNTTRLATIAASYLKLQPHETLSLSEKLYLEGLISYPRTETDRYSREILDFAYKILREMQKKKFIPKDVEIGSPRQGKKDDRAHPPIHPKKFIDPSKVKKRLGSRANELYELICRHFVANFLPNAKLIRFEIIATDSNGEKYKAEILVPETLGFLTVYKYHQELKRIAKKDIAPSILRQKKMRILSVNVGEKTPAIVYPISEGELVKLMEKLGIGTDATFAEHIRKNIDRGYVVRERGRLIPTPYGLAIAQALKDIVPEVIDPKIRARIESFFSAVEEGKMTREEAVRDAIAQFVKIYEKFRRNISLFINKVVKGVEELGLSFFRKLKREKRGRRKKRRRKRR